MTRIALVVLDTLRKDAFDRHFGWLPGTRFENAWSPSHWTIPVHASLLTGRYPSEHAVHARSRRLDSEQVLTERLSTTGYGTHAFVSNGNLSPTFRFDRGFDTFDTSTRARTLQGERPDWEAVFEGGIHAGRGGRAVWDCLTGEYATGPSLREGVAAAVRERSERVACALSLAPHLDSGAREAVEYVRNLSLADNEFVFINLMETHAPLERVPNEYRTEPEYEPPADLGLRQTLHGADGDRLRQAYDDATAYLAAVYRELFAALVSRMDVVITLSDHGELLGDHGLWGHEYGLHPELTHVPLVVSDGTEGIERRDELVSLLDVHRTILDLAGMDESDSGRGRSLFESVPKRDVLTEAHGLPPERSERLSTEGLAIDRYDIEARGIAMAETDSGTRAGYAHRTAEGWVCDPDTISDASNRLERIVADLDERSAPESITLSDRTRQQLEDLGYA